MTTKQTEPFLANLRLEYTADGVLTINKKRVALHDRAGKQCMRSWHSQTKRYSYTTMDAIYRVIRESRNAQRVPVNKLGPS